MIEIPAMARMFLLILTGFLGALSRPAACGERPVVAVLSQEIPDEEPYLDYTSYITSNYVKAVESSGARVVPVFIGKGEDYYRGIVSRLNGLLIPGGTSNYSRKGGIFEASSILLELAKQSNEDGAHFPVLGVCMGMEILSYLWAGMDYGVLVNCSAEDLPLPLDFEPGFRESSLFRRASEEEIAILSQLPVTANHHRNCLTEKKFSKFSLDKDWKVLSTNRDRNGLEFLSSIEHRKYPFVGLQFHPEKNSFEWSEKQVNPHSGKAVRSSRLFYDWLVGEARKSPAAYPNKTQENDDLIYNYNPVFTGKMDEYDIQNYFFH